MLRVEQLCSASSDNYPENYRYVAGMRLVDGDYLIIVTPDYPGTAISKYSLRWEIGVSRLRTLHLVGESPTEVKDSSLVAWEASWRASKTMEPSDNILRKEYAQCTRL